MKIDGKLLLIASSILLLSSCDSPKSKPVETPPLSPDTKAKVEQDLRNGVIPSPQDMTNDNVGNAPDKCAKFISELPQDWFHDKIEVPEDPENPNGRKIKIFYYGKIKPNTTPTMFFNGGPGSDSHSTFRSITNNQHTFDKDGIISPVFLDQRGNGCSDYYPQGTSDEILQRLANYGSNGIVSDAEHVRKKILGEKKWNVFGQSYGGHIVHRYLIQSPEGVNSGFSHANILQSDGYVRLKNRIASQVRVYKNYLQRFPEDEAKFLALKNYLTPERCFINPYDSKEQACGHSLLDSLNSLLGFSESWLSLHQWIGLMVPENEVDEKNVGRFMSTFYFDEDDSNPLNIKYIAHRVIGWVDRNTVPGTVENCHKVKADLNQQNVNLDMFPVNECSSALQEKFDPNEPAKPESEFNLKVKSLTRKIMTIDQLKNVLIQNQKTYLYLYSGQLDTFVPVENFAEQLAVIKDMSNVRYTHFNGTGHNGFNAEPKVWNDLLSNSK